LLPVSTTVAKSSKASDLASSLETKNNHSVFLHTQKEHIPP